MQMQGQQRIAASRQKVWVALNDPAMLQRSIPGCQSLEKTGENQLAAVVEIKIGPIGARFKGDVHLADLDPPNGYTLTGQGNGGVAGNAKGTARVQLADDGAGTLLCYTVDAEVGGRMAQLGGPIIDATAKQLAGKFFDTFGALVAGDTPKPAEGPTAPLTPAVTAASSYTASAKPSAAPWHWLVALALAIFTGFLLGRSLAADWWVLAVAVLAVVAAGAGYTAGARGQAQP